MKSIVAIFIYTLVSVFFTLSSLADVQDSSQIPKSECNDKIEIISPAPDSVLSGPTVTVAWGPGCEATSIIDIDYWWIYVGTYKGGNNIHSQGYPPESKAAMISKPSFSNPR